MSKPDTADRIPSGIATVPGFPGVQVSFAGYNRDGTACIWYIGNHDELIAAGVATEQMLAPGIRGRQRVDIDGDCFAVRRYWVGPEGQRQQRYQVMRDKRAELLPAANAAIEAHRRRQAWMDARSEFAAVSEKRFLAELERRHGSGERSRRPSYLRLVVDNTRRQERP